ncbi:hypothetical protein ACFL1X_12255 [Candidatus Hydrogenedentota bacterium]
MKCPECSNNHKKKYGLRCECGYDFVFNPAEDKMTDGRFTILLNKASANDTYHFTTNQLYGAYCRKMSPTAFKTLGCLLVGLLSWGGAVAIAVFADSEAGLLGGFLFLGGLICVIAGLVGRFKPTPSFESVERFVEKWRSARKDLPKLITGPSLHTPPPEWKEGDIYDYGAERILIVGREIVVDWLVLNEFHAQQRTVVVSEMGYPDYLLPVARKMLEERPDLPVFLLHDSTRKGEDMLKRVMVSNSLYAAYLGGRMPLDLGLHPEDVKQIGAFRALKPRRTEYRMPVDCLPYQTLAAGLEGAMAEGVSLGELLRRSRNSDDGGDPTDGFG